MTDQAAPTATKITGLSRMNVDAIIACFPPDVVTVTATTATFHYAPAEAVALVESTIARLPGRGHPRASLHAVARRLRAVAG